MSVVAILDIAHPDLGLLPTVRTVPDADIRAIRHCGTDPETGRFTVLVEPADSDSGTGTGEAAESGSPAAANGGEADAARTDAVLAAFEAAIADDHTVASHGTVARADEGGLYQLVHAEEAKLVTPRTRELGGIVRESKRAGDRWRMHLQFPDRESLASLWAHCETAGIDLDLRRLYRQDGWAVDEPSELTDPQRTALLTAHREGYFEEPRGVSLEGLAEELDLSPTAVGGRIRRGVLTLIETTLVEE